MALDLADYETKARAAVQTFWGNREQARQKHADSGRLETGERGSVTAGKNMDGFIALMIDLVQANGLSRAAIYQNRALLTLPGYFRPAKLWDLLVLNNNQLIAAIEFKSQVGPSFGNNFNNRAEEAIGTAHDLWLAYREGVFGAGVPPFVGWLMLVEDAPESRSSVRDGSPHFPVFPEFQGASYLQRYHILCQRLMRERLYTSASTIISPRSAVVDGQYSDVNKTTGLQAFITSFAGYIASEAAKQT